MGAWVIAGVTFREAARKKTLWMALIAGGAFLALFATALHFQTADVHSRIQSPIIRTQIANGMLMVGMYAADILAVLMTILTAADTLSGEISSGTLHAVATKPVARREILLGKWLGFAAMLSAYVLLMTGGVAAIGALISGASAHHLISGMLLIWLESILLLNVTLLCGTSYTTLTTGVIVLGLHGVAFLGGWIEQIGALTSSPRAVDAGILASIIMPSESLWRRAAFEMQSPLSNALRFSPFSSASVPSHLMVAYAALYLAVALALALRQFRLKDL